MNSTVTPARDKLVPLIMVGIALLAGALAVVAPQLSLLAVFALIGGFGLSRVLPRWIVLALFIALLAFQFSIVGPLGAELSPQNVGVIVLLALIADRVWRRDIRIPTVSLGGVVAAYTVLGLLALGFGPLMSGGIRDIWVLYRLVLLGPLAYFIFAVLVDHPHQIRRALTFLAVGAAIAGIVGIVQTVTGGALLSGITTNQRYLGLFHRLPNELIDFYVLNPDLRITVPGFSIFRAHGTYEHANAYGVFLSAVLFLTWGLFATARTNYARIFWLILLACQLGGLFASFSRSAWVASFAGSLFLFFLEMRTRITHPRQLLKPLASAVVFALLFLIALQQVPAFAERVQSLTNPQEVGELRWRINIWRYVTTQIVQNPFLGAGTTVISAVDVGFGDELESFSSHNLILSLGYERGLIALLIYLFIVIAYFVTGWRLQSNNGIHVDSRTLATALLAAMISFQVSGIGSASMNYAGLAMLFWLMIALMFAIARNERRNLPLKTALSATGYPSVIDPC